VTNHSETFYSSSNGDRWQLIHSEGRTSVRHEPNISSGGKASETDVEQFLEGTGTSPQNAALRANLEQEGDIPKMPDDGVSRRYFDLSTLDPGGKGRGIFLQEKSLSWSSSFGPRHRGFDGIIAIELGVEGGDPLARCDILFDNDERLRAMITADMEFAEAVTTYREFVSVFLERLGPEQTRIRFRYGLVRRTAATAFAVGLASFFALFIVLVFSEAVRHGDYGWLLIPATTAGALMCALGIWAAVSNGQRLFDPGAVPPSALPALPRGMSAVPASRERRSG
jgi:hypothetical protein